MIHSQTWLAIAAAVIALAGNRNITGAQAAPTHEDVKQIIRGALNATISHAKFGARGVSADSAWSVDTSALTLRSSDRARVYPRLSLADLQLAQSARASSRNEAFACPPRIPSPQISPACTFRSNRAFVNFFDLDIVDGSTATVWVSILAPNVEPTHPRSHPFHVTTVQVRLTKIRGEWSQPTIIKTVAG